MKQRVIIYAIQVFGSKVAADNWLDSENPAFGNKKPNNLLNSDKGCELVIDILSLIEDGQLTES
jgi:putative toxin-antitoxin system antitoxin component (TIGR02293 family)